ncbi:hypothetical protein AMS68_000958 [Peltaster fructicola]|uniref:endo-1,3(4)-beta-glucanase n=1 Tax=Peltaster fructicola TaxID=286661 RepID=A0A6H0XLC6_9PEZI|nr:hypothetical protein AMS68_000958 [Peltaster fructicola]
MMSPEPPVAMASLLHMLSLSALVSAQSIPGASFFSGNGVPGAGTYQLIDDYQPSIFFNKFNFYSSYDPTYGHVQYVNQSVAVKNGFVSTTSANTAKIGVDTTNDWPRGGPGRPSVRIVSDNTYTHGLFIFDANHMPWGCGTWPAYWLLGPNWPYTGEIDIIEGVNTLNQDSISLHSSAGCTIAGSGQTGTLQTTNCDSNANGNSGCGSTLPNSTIPNNYGNSFNQAGGGVYVTEWTSAYFKTWFFPRGSVPSSITSGQPDVSTFGTPVVNQQGSCDVDQHFTNMSIIINIDFCGAWAGQVYSQYTDCPQNTSTNSLNSCVDFVGNNPSYFTNAYWDINSIRVYQMPAGAQPSSSYSTSLSSVMPSATTNSINLGMGQTTTELSSAPYTGPISSATASTSASPTPTICPSYNNTQWTDSNGQEYTIGCGSDYDGAGTGLPQNGIYSATNFENCMEICDTISGCIAVSFVGGNGAGTCYAKSTTGTFVFSGAVNAAILIDASASISASSLQSSSPSSASLASLVSSSILPTSSSSPVCPGAAASTYMDSQGISYDIICYTDYADSNIGAAISFNSLAACLPACDSMSGCVGVVFNPDYDLCQLKSSFTGTQTGNTSVIAAMRLAMSATTSAAVSSTPQTISASTESFGMSQTSMIPSVPSTSTTTMATLNVVSSSSTSSMQTSASVLLSLESSTATISTSSSAAVTSSFSIQPSISSTATSSAVPPSTSSSVSMSSMLASSTSPQGTVAASSISTSQSAQISTSLSTSKSAAAQSSSSTSMVITSTWNPSQLPGASAAVSITSAAACPTNDADFCDQDSQQETTCSDSTGTIYFVACGYVYVGNIIDTSGIYGRDYQLLSRATEPDVTSCQRLCDRTNRCIAFNYIGTDCVLLSSVTSAVSNANAIGGSIIRAVSAVSSTSTSTIYMTASQLSSTSQATFPTLLSSITSTQTTATTQSAVTLTTTVTTSIPPGGYFSTGSNGSFYVYPTSSGSASLCFTCGITPTVVTDPTGSVTRTCSTALVGTTTVFTTVTITSCGPQPTCPASGYVIVGPSQDYPGQQVVTTTGRSGGLITYTQIPSSTSTPASSTTSAATAQPSCPRSDGSIYTDSMGVQYKIYCDTVFTDPVLDTQTQSTLSGCIASCDMYNIKTFNLGTQCFGISWYEDLAIDNCLLKSGITPVPSMGIDSGALLYPQSAPNNTSSGTGGSGAASNTGPGGYGTVTYTTSVPPTTEISTYTTTAPASTITIFSTIYTNGQISTTAIGYSTVPGTTIVGVTTNIVSGYTTVTERPAGPGTNAGTGGVPSTAFSVSTAISTYISNGQTILSTYGVTTVATVVYLPAPTQTKTVTTTSISVLLVPTTIITTLSQGYTTTIVTYVPAPSNGIGGPGPTQTQIITATSVQVSIAYVPTTIVTTVSQGYTTTIVTSVPVTYTEGGGAGSGSGGGTVTVSAGGGGATTVYITLTVTRTVLPSSSSSSFTCRTYATNYLNGLHGRAEPTSPPMMRNGVVLEPVIPVPEPMGRRRSIFEKEVILAEMAHVRSFDMGLGLWFIE